MAMASPSSIFKNLVGLLLLCVVVSKAPTQCFARQQGDEALTEYTEHVLEGIERNCREKQYCPSKNGGSTKGFYETKFETPKNGVFPLEEGVDIGQHRRERMEAYLSERSKCDDPRYPESYWAIHDMDSENITYGSGWRQGWFTESPYNTNFISLSLCEVEDKTESSGWTFTRVGPFVARGGYDWHDGGIHHVPRNPKGRFITAKMFAPITPDGRILGYPPIHAHHVHYTLDGIQHWFDSHGDSICSEEMGGTACYLREQPAGYGFPLLESDEYTLDFVLNDVRELGSPAMTFYLETSLRWSSDMTLTPVSRANLRMHATPMHDFNTMLLPLEEDSVVWTTGKWLVDGQVIYSPMDQTPWVHSHRSFLKGHFAFAASPEELGLTLDLLEQTPQDQVPENMVGRSYQESSDLDQCWIPRNQDAHDALEEKIKNSKAGMGALRCWLNPSNEEGKTLEFVKGTDTSPVNHEAWQQNWEETWYDRVGQVNCNPWSFKKGDNYTIVAINGLRDELADLDKPNLQHIGFKLEYETFGEEIGPNVEVFSPYSDSFSTLESGFIESVYKLPLSYTRCFSAGIGCSADERNDYAQWYYEMVASGAMSEDKCEEDESTAVCEKNALDLLMSDCTYVLGGPMYNVSHPKAYIAGKNDIPFDFEEEDDDDDDDDDVDDAADLKEREAESKLKKLGEEA